jgi:hypothetical protein
MNKKKILVLATGWHFSSHFYETLPKQVIPDGWVVDYCCIAHRMPDDLNAMSEKDYIRNGDSNNFLSELDMILYDRPLSVKDIESFGWNFTLEDNTIGDMEVFNQWSDKNDYKQYDIILITHDDNFILSNSIFCDILSEDTLLFKPIVNSRYGVIKHQFKVELVNNDNDWYFIDNGYTESIPKAFTPRGSFCFYKKELIDLLPNNKFDMSNIDLKRIGKTDTPVNHRDLTSWNTNAGNFRDFLYKGKSHLELVGRTRWLSNTKRVSKYCIEGERGLISNCRADGNRYIGNLQTLLKKLELI